MTNIISFKKYKDAKTPQPKPFDMDEAARLWIKWWFQLAGWKTE